MSEEARGFVPSEPPTISTLPSCITAMACLVRGEESVPAKLKLPLEGSKSSRVLLGLPELSPPAIRTVPSCSRAAVAFARADVMGWVWVQLSLDGS